MSCGGSTAVSVTAVDDSELAPPASGFPLGEGCCRSRNERGVLAKKRIGVALCGRAKSNISLRRSKFKSGYGYILFFKL